MTKFHIVVEKRLYIDFFLTVDDTADVEKIALEKASEYPLEAWNNGDNAVCDIEKKSA
jgi:hypothetical protein